MVSFTPEATEPQLADLLDNALHELVLLRAGANRLRSSKAWMPRLLAFSPSALDRLCAVIGEGCEAIARRVAELRPVGEPACAKFLAAGNPADGLEASASRGRTRGLNDPQSLLIAYRASARSLCASLVEARRLRDANTAAMLSGLIHRLEKQLWLLDSPEPSSRDRIGLSTINLFLSC